jgi:glycosyltransferase involved in cell wall biosynthesis
MDYFLPKKYQSRSEPSYFADAPTEIVHQPHVYEFAQALARRMEATRIVDLGAGNGLKVVPLNGEFDVFAYDFGENLDLLAQQLGSARVDSIDLESPSDLKRIAPVLDGSIVVFSDVVEHLVKPEIVLDFFAANLSRVLGIVISTPERRRARGPGDMGPPANPAHIREWEFEEFAKLLSRHSLTPLLHGYTVNSTASTSRNTQLAFIPGGKSGIARDSRNEVSVLAVVPCYNEADVIGSTISRLLEQEMTVHVIDNWSNDGTWEFLASSFAGDLRVTLERFPNEPTPAYRWKEILRRMSNIASESNHEWFIHVDADEKIDSPIPGLSVREFIGMADVAGYNIIDLTLVDFRPYKSTMSGALKLDKWEFGLRPGAVSIERAFKINSGDIDLASAGGHKVGMAHPKPFPINLVLRHYPLRSPQHARKKIFRDRRPRFREERRKFGFHVQYDSFYRWSRFLWKEKNLFEWNQDTVQEWMPEFTTRAGLGFAKE